MILGKLKKFRGNDFLENRRGETIFPIRSRVENMTNNYLQPNPLGHTHTNIKGAMKIGGPRIGLAPNILPDLESYYSSRIIKLLQITNCFASIWSEIISLLLFDIRFRDAEEEGDRKISKMEELVGPQNFKLVEFLGPQISRKDLFTTVFELSSALQLI